MYSLKPAIGAISAICLIFLSCQRPAEKAVPQQDIDPLPSWHATNTKTRILEFVENALKEGAAGFVPVEDRIAVFDNDGTLWAEKPLYNHFFVIVTRIVEMVEDKPELQDDPAIKALYDFAQTKDSKSLAFFLQEVKEEKYLDLVGQLFGKAFEGMSVDDYNKVVREYYQTWEHPVLKKKLNKLTYKPMKELIDYLAANDFTVYIFTADEGPFLKLYSKEFYGVPPERVFGTATSLEYRDGELFRTSEGGFLDNWDYKAKLIYQVTGKRPVFAAGNSNGDFHMLQYVNAGSPPNMSMVLHHTDSIREMAYDSHTDQTLPYAREHNYVIVDMAKDWSTVFEED